MKANIHPNWHHDCVVTCSCGSSFTTGAITQTIQVDICSACHPFFTGEMKFVDRQGRVDKFMKKMKVAQAKQKSGQKKKTKKKSNQADDKSYQQILREQKHKVNRAARQGELRSKKKSPGGEGALGYKIRESNKDKEASSDAKKSAKNK